MKITDTIIKWHRVNMRIEDKDIPERGRRIIYWDSCICAGIVSVNSKDQLCVNDYNSRNSKNIKTGFLWCYQNDIAIPKEIE